MSAHYLDSSAWVKRHIDEPGSSIVSQLFTDGAAFVCSVVGVIEVLSALSRRSDVAEAALQKTAFLVRTEFAKFQAIDLNGSVLKRATDLPMVYRLRAGDAIHLASAMAYRDARPNDEVIFVSSDKELLAAAASSRFATIDPAADDG